MIIIKELKGKKACVLKYIMTNLLGPQEGGIWPRWTNKGDRWKGNVKNNFPSAQLPLIKSGLIRKHPALPKI